MKIGLIYAASLNGVIGSKGKIPWNLPEDMAHFKQITTGTTVIMGRRTWESLPDKYKPLPNRVNIVLTRQGLAVPEGVQVLDSLNAALDLSRHKSQVWIIGGSSVYNEALSLADTIEETVVHLECDGDTFAPLIDKDKWKVDNAVAGISKCGYGYTFLRHTRAG